MIADYFFFSQNFKTEDSQKKIVEYDFLDINSLIDI